MIGQAVEVILDGQVLTEVQVLLQLVAVSIELTVKPYQSYRDFLAWLDSQRYLTILTLTNAV